MKYCLCSSALLKHGSTGGTQQGRLQIGFPKRALGSLQEQQDLRARLAEVQLSLLVANGGPRIVPYLEGPVRAERFPGALLRRGPAEKGCSAPVSLHGWSIQRYTDIDGDPTNLPSSTLGLYTTPSWLWMTGILFFKKDFIYLSIYLR